MPKLITRKDALTALKERKPITDLDGKPIRPFSTIKEPSVEPPIDYDKETLTAIKDLTDTLKKVLSRPDMAQALGFQMVTALQKINDKELKVMLQMPKREKKTVTAEITDYFANGRIRKMVLKEI